MNERVQHVFNHNISCLVFSCVWKNALELALKVSRLFWQVDANEEFTGI
jgi:hypothetical protein